MHQIKSGAIMKWFLVTIALLLLITTITGCRSKKDIDNANNDGYKGIYIGQKETDLPKWLRGIPSLHYDGIHEGAGFSVWILDGRVTILDIIYSGKMKDETLINKPVTLAEALKEHSLSHTGTPVLGLVKGKNDSTHTLVDLTNRITFETARSVDPASQVVRVTYVDKDAPLLSTDSTNKLSDKQTSTLIVAAQSSNGVKSQKE
jgi:hypothetical protein